jgi:hypothetical protein
MDVLYSILLALYSILLTYISGCIVAGSLIAMLNDTGDDDLLEIPYMPAWYSWIVVLVIFIIFIRVLFR